MLKFSFEIFRKISFHEMFCHLRQFSFALMDFDERKMQIASLSTNFHRHGYERKMFLNERQSIKYDDMSWTMMIKYKKCPPANWIRSGVKNIACSSSFSFSFSSLTRIIEQSLKFHETRIRLSHFVREKTCIRN